MPKRAATQAGFFGCLTKGKTSSPCSDERTAPYRSPSSPSTQTAARSATTAARTLERKAREDERAQRTAARNIERKAREDERAQRTAARTATRAIAQQERDQRKQAYLEQRKNDRKAIVKSEYDEFVRNRPHISIEDKKRYLENLYTLYDTETRNHLINMALQSQNGGSRRKRKPQNKQY